MKKIFVLSFVFIISSCQIGYYISSAHNQFSMMSTRVSITEAFQSPNLNESQKNKILLSQKARMFAFEKLKLKRTENYNSFIDLKRPYVTWVVHAAEKWQMKNYEWKYPIVGAMPYKGFFNENDAKAEADELLKNGFDTYVRGVSAYSTLGWFTDSLLSSMLRYKDHDLVNTIIHEITHTTIYIKNNSDFNERLAVFIGGKGSEMFYKEFEGENSPTLQLIADENADDKLFSEFITKELKNLEKWYIENPAIVSAKDESARAARLNLIHTNFETELAPRLKTNSYQKFTKEKMNNARMGLYKTYMQGLNDFEEAYKRHGSDLLKFIDVIKKLEDSKDPEADLRVI
jgi:predicted aminopeptidase